MRVYHHQRRRHSLFVAPAGDPRATIRGVDSDWIEADGSPKNFLVDFDADGIANVPDALGRYLIATRQAKVTRLWTPNFGVKAA